MANEVTKVGAGDTIFLVAGKLPMGQHRVLEGAAFTSKERAEALIDDLAKTQAESISLEWPLGLEVLEIAIDW